MGTATRRASTGRLGVAVLGSLCALGFGGTLAACSSDGADAAAEDRVVVHVFGAASLTDAFQELEVAFEAEQPGYDVQLNLAGSASLRAQVTSGAPVDVFASANTEVMDDVVALDTTIGSPTPFATNRLQIAVPSGNPGELTGLEDFANESLFLGLCAETVPCGSLAEAALAAAAVVPSVDTREPDVRALLTKIEAAELDGGIVYATDVAASPDDVDGIDIPAALGGAAIYPIAVLDQGDAADGGSAFVMYVLGPSGVRILTDHGFGTP